MKISLFTLLVVVSVDYALSNRVVVVTGATGRTGSLIYKSLKDAGVTAVRAAVRSTNVTEAQTILNCTRCDATEGVFLGADVTKPESLTAAFSGATDLMDAVGFTGTNQSLMASVEWHGVENQVNVSLKSMSLRLTLASSLTKLLPTSESLCHSGHRIGERPSGQHEPGRHQGRPLFFDGVRE